MHWLVRFGDLGESLGGGRVLQENRAGQERRLPVWPLDEVRPPLVVEIWPRVFIGEVRKSRHEERRRFLDEHWPGIPERAGDEPARLEGAIWRPAR